LRELLHDPELPSGEGETRERLRRPAKATFFPGCAVEVGVETHDGETVPHGGGVLIGVIKVQAKP